AVASLRRSRSCHWLGRGLDPNQSALFQGVRRIHNNQVLLRDALKDLERSAVIATDNYGPQTYMIACIHGGHTQTFRTEEEGIAGKLQTVALDLQSEVRLRVAAGQEFRAAVGNVHFGEERTGGRINRVGGADDLAFKSPPGILRELEIGGKSRM